MTISKAYIEQVFKSSSVQLTPEALIDIINHLRQKVSLIAVVCNNHNIRRLKSKDLLYIFQEANNE